MKRMGAEGCPDASEARRGTVGALVLFIGTVSAASAITCLQLTYAYVTPLILRCLVWSGAICMGMGR